MGKNSVFQGWNKDKSYPNRQDKIGRYNDGQLEMDKIIAIDWL